jgi:rhodanese-related sulfurtransferase
LRTASLAVKKGYKNVYVYRDGLPEWEKHGYPVESDVTYPDAGTGTVSGEDLKKMIAAGEDIIVLDVRDDVDFGRGRIGVSINIALDDMHERWEELPKDRKIVLVDRHGRQVRNSARYLAYKGLTNTVMLEKGFVDSWKVLGYPVKEGP